MTVNNLDGSTSTVYNSPLCGYNKDNLFYCPWALGDAPAQSVFQKLIEGGYFFSINANCNPKSFGQCADIPYDLQDGYEFYYSQFMFLFSNKPNATNLGLTPFIANNA